MHGLSGPRRVRVSVPATSANLGPGFDAIGVALGLRGEVEVTLAEEPQRASDRGVAMATEAVGRVFERLGRPRPNVRVRFNSAVPVARGLGASAIVRVGAALAAAVLAGATPGEPWLLDLTSALEGHADNVAPALLGGLQVVVQDAGVIQHAAVPLPEGLVAILFVPDFEMSTDKSRRLLPRSLTRADAVHNSSRAALLVAALATGRLDLLRVATGDRLHQPARSQLFPSMYEIFDAAASAGALCAYLSGGGSSILAIAEHADPTIGEAMQSAAGGRGVNGRIIMTSFSERGAEVVEQD